MSNQANSVKRTAEKLNVSDRKVWQLIARGDLRAIKIDRRTLVTDRQIDEFLQQREQVA